MDDNNDNPYQAPQSNIIAVDSAAEETRTQHIKHEATIKSIGALYYIGAFFFIISSIGMLLAGFSEETLMSITLGSAFLLFGVVQFWTARKLRALSPKARIPTTIISTLGLVGFPFGTLINAYILYVIHCKKGRFILTPEYQEIVEATPDIKYQTSILVWVFVGALLLLIAAAIVMPIIK